MDLFFALWFWGSILLLCTTPFILILLERAEIVRIAVVLFNIGALAFFLLMGVIMLALVVTI